MIRLRSQHQRPVPPPHGAFRRAAARDVVPALAAVAALIVLSGCREEVLKQNPPPAPEAVPVPVLGRNLLLNADAERVQTVSKPGLQPPQTDAPSDWTLVGDPTITEYGREADEWPDAKAGCEDGRKRYFRLSLALNEASETLHQSVAIGGTEADIDAGSVECALGGWFGGWVNGDATARLEVDFIGEGDRKLGTLATEPPDPATLPPPATGRASLTKVLATGPVPPGTRRLEARLVALRPKGKLDSNAVAAADNLSVVLRKKGM